MSTIQYTRRIFRTCRKFIRVIETRGFDMIIFEYHFKALFGL